VTKESNIIIKFKSDINRNTVNNDNFKITGSISGTHNFQIIYPDEKNILILKPEIYFSPGELVRVNIYRGLSSINGYKFPQFEFSFSISGSNLNSRNEIRIPYSEEYLKSNITNSDNSNNISPVIRSELLPPDFPSITILAKDNPNEGYIFLCNFIKFSPGPNMPYLMVLDNKGHPFLYKRMGVSCLDFKVQNNNTFTYFLGGLVNKFYSTSPSFAIKDSFYCGNGYSTDPHELLLFPNNHAYLMSYDSQRVDMSQIISGGNPNAIVSGLIIQEIDENKNVIFQWRSWDHFNILDANHIDFLGANIDYVHGNAIDLDFDGHVLISSRHLDEITKINRQTGQIIWRLGGKNNQFTFINDTISTLDSFYFSHQHAIRKLANGNYLIFDNGNFHSPAQSRVIEYDLDEVNKTATLVWEYRNSPKIYAFAMGNAQRLDDGNTVIGWGSANPTMSEVRPDGTKTFELTFAPAVVSYRAFRHTWDGAPSQIPSTHILEQNYPNPFNPLTSIRFGLSENSHVVLKIYDLLGRDVSTLVDENLEAGRYTVNFNAANLASGVYFYKLTANGFTEAKKMILVK
jgi:hypothetical protein